MATHEQIQTVAKHLVVAALWADSEEGSYPRATRKSHQVAFGICKAFIEAYPDLFIEAMQRSEVGYGCHSDAGSAEAAFGHDLWLTSQGHGAGFWDSTELEAFGLGDVLTKVVNEFQKTIAISCEQYRGWMYIHAWDRVSLINRFE